MVEMYEARFHYQKWGSFEKKKHVFSECCHFCLHDGYIN